MSKLHIPIDKLSTPGQRSKRRSDVRNFFLTEYDKAFVVCPRCVITRPKQLFHDSTVCEYCLTPFAKGNRVSITARAKSIRDEWFTTYDTLYRERVDPSAPKGKQKPNPVFRREVARYQTTRARVAYCRKQGKLVEYCVTFEHSNGHLYPPVVGLRLGTLKEVRAYAKRIAQQWNDRWDKDINSIQRAYVANL